MALFFISHKEAVQIAEEVLKDLAWEGGQTLPASIHQTQSWILADEPLFNSHIR